MYEFTAPLWLSDGDAPWHFVTVPEDVSDDIYARTAQARRGSRARGARRHAGPRSPSGGNGAGPRGVAEGGRQDREERA